MPCKGGPKGHGGMKRNKHGATKYESDKDTGYVWGKAGRAKAKKAGQRSGYLWEGEKKK